MLAVAIFGARPPKRLCNQSMDGCRSRSNIQHIRPSAHIFLQRSASLLETSIPLTAASVILEMSIAISTWLLSVPSSSGLPS